MSTKIIVTNNGVLKKKYLNGTKKIQAAIKKLIAADKNRGVTTKLVALDNKTQMKKLGAPAVEDPTDPKRNKRAIDAVYKALLPDYLLILGSIDAVPHQNLKNPVYDPYYDDDRCAYGDLPYACDAPYSREPAKFLGPTRVVGRLPDVTGARDPAYLVQLLHTAAAWSPGKPADYASYFAVSADLWKQSTGLSLRNIFGFSDDLKLSPPHGPAWKKQLLSRVSHFINCHGALADSKYYGQKGEDYPVSHTARYVDSKISKGTVATAECCYGAELYDPESAGDVPGIANTYMLSEAYGFMGSSTIAYGPSEGNGEADLICQFFLKHVLEGASLGRALLQARQDFVASEPELDPYDLKTIAQFSLLGDPSIHPVRSVKHVTGLPKGIAPKRLAAVAVDLLAGRSSRRRHLARRGTMIAQTARYAKRAPKLKAAAPVSKDLKALIKKAKMTKFATATYRIRGGAAPKGMKVAFAAAKPPTEAFHVVVGLATRKKTPVLGIKVLVAKEEAGKLVSYKTLYSK